MSENPRSPPQPMSPQPKQIADYDFTKEREKDQTPHALNHLQPSLSTPISQLFSERSRTAQFTQFQQKKLFKMPSNIDGHKACQKINEVTILSVTTSSHCDQSAHDEECNAAREEPTVVQQFMFSPLAPVIGSKSP